MVNLYHLKEFELPALNDMLILSLLEGATAQAERQLAAFVTEFDALVEQREAMTQLAAQTLDACLAAAKKLPVEPSTLVRPAAAPGHCGVFFGLWRNVVAIAPTLGMPELAQKHGPQPEWLSPAAPARAHRRVQCGDLSLDVGAY